MRSIDAANLKSLCDIMDDKSPSPMWKQFKTMIDDMPKVDPFRHGHWVYLNDNANDTGGWCSICKGAQPAYWLGGKWQYCETPYCPNCSAKMDEVINEQE